MASVASKARRGAFNASPAGASNFFGDKELIDDVASGRVDLDAIPADALPEMLQEVAPAEREATVLRIKNERAQLQRQIAQLAGERADYLTKKVAEAGGAKDSLDQKIYEAVRDQASEAGLAYADGPDY
jgi:hypothetical protein